MVQVSVPWCNRSLPWKCRSRWTGHTPWGTRKMIDKWARCSSCNRWYRSGSRRRRCRSASSPQAPCTISPNQKGMAFRTPRRPPHCSCCRPCTSLGTPGRRDTCCRQNPTDSTSPLGSCRSRRPACSPSCTSFDSSPCQDPGPLWYRRLCRFHCCCNQRLG